MKKYLKYALAACLFAIAFIAGAVSFLWLGRRLIGLLRDLDSSLHPALISALAVVAVAVVTFLTQRHIERFRSREASLREEKRAAYEDLTAILFGALGMEGEKLADKELVEKMNALFRPLLLNASTDVIAKWSAYQRLAASSVDPTNTKPASAREQTLALEKVLLAIRKDLGHSTRRVQPGELVSLFIRDFKNMK